MLPPPRVMLGITNARGNQRQKEQEEHLCNSIKMYCCIFFTVGALIYLLIFIVSIIYIFNSSYTRDPLDYHNNSFTH